MDRGSETQNKGFGLSRAKLPWWALWVGAGLVAVLVFVVLSQVPGLIGRMLGSALHSTTKGMQSQVLEAVPTQSTKPVKPAQESAAKPVKWAKPAAGKMEVSPVTVTGFMGSRERGRVALYLSDGRIIDEKSGVKIEVYRYGVVIDGMRYNYAKPKSSPVPLTIQPPVVVVDQPQAESEPLTELPPPPPPEPSAWQMYSDGVQRIVTPSAIGR